MKTIKGNLLDLAEQGMFDIILHGCNCQNTMKSGIAGEIAKRYPWVVEADLQTVKGDRGKLGSASSAAVNLKNHTFLVVNMYTQEYYGRDSSVQYVEYWAVDSALKYVASYLQQRNWTDVRIGYPKVGCGLANGDWNIVSQIFESVLSEYDHTLVILED